MIRKMDFLNMRSNLKLLMLALLLAGCSGVPEPFEVPTTHPANPDAPQASFARPTIQKGDDAEPSPEQAESSEGSMGGMDMGGMSMGGHMHNGNHAEGGK